mgnify:CR=1 FL=1
MTDSNAFDFTKFVPGFDFLKNLQTQGAAAGMGPSSWVAPTLDPQELEKRIQELKAVQFWLNQNTQAIAATIQALEVQRMTLKTLQDMNMSMGDLAESLKAKPSAWPTGASMFAANASKAAEEKPAPSPKKATAPRAAAKGTSASSKPAAGAAIGVNCALEVGVLIRPQNHFAALAIAGGGGVDHGIAAHDHGLGVRGAAAAEVVAADQHGAAAGVAAGVDCAVAE